MASIEEKVENLIKKDIIDLGYDLYDVEYVKEGKDYYLRIYIDNEKGISIDDCEKVTNAINDKLDKADYIKEQYYLEVSSSGLEKIIRKDRHLDLALGKEIEVRLYKSNEGKKEYTGILKSYSQDEIVLENKILKRNEISQIKTIFHWK